MIGDVFNTITLMTFAIETMDLANKNPSLEELDRRGFSPHYIDGDYPNILGDIIPSITNEKYRVFLEYGGFDFGIGRVSCNRMVELLDAGAHINANSFDDPYNGMIALTGSTSDDSSTSFVGFRGIARSEGESEEAYKEAILDMLDKLFSVTLSGISLSPKGMKYSFTAEDYSSFLWFTLFERLTVGDMRRCNVCGKYFVANLGDANERGGSPKTNCGPNCRQTGYLARKARKLMEEGMDIEKAAKKVHISVEKLKLFLELNPTDPKGADNGS